MGRHYKSIGYPTYSRELRERAKQEKKYMVTMDIVRPGGGRDICSQGLMDSAEVQTIYSAIGRVLKARNAKNEATK